MAPVSSPQPASGRAGRDASPTILANRYRLEEHLAYGGMAEVWLATDITLDRKVALKWLKPTLATDPVVAERFRREAIAVAGLNHPNIVAVHDVFEESGRQAVVMQLVDGKSLRQVLDVQTRLSPDLTIHIGNCVAAALDVAHKAGFVHRDVKPGNIMLTPDGRVLLTDFGIAKGLAGTGTDDLTHDNVMMGTAKYLSPEQVRGRKLDGRADLYSLGLVLYECIAGRVPFQGESDADTALARLQRDPTDLSQLRPSTPRALVSIIHRLLARNRDDRPSSGAELRTALARVSSEPASKMASTGSGSQVVADSVLGRSPRTSGSNPRVGGTTRGVRGPGQTVSGRNRQIDRTSSPRNTGSIPTVYAQHTPSRVRAPRPDRTPEAGPRVRGTPARSMQQRWTPSLTVVGALLLAALIVAFVLFTTIRGGRTGGAGDGPSTGDTAGAPSGPTPGSIASLGVFDPAADGENDGEVDKALAGSGSYWPTKCYQSQFMGSLGGVGLVITLEGTSGGTISADVGTAPFQVDVYASPDEQAPSSIESWGGPVADRLSGDQPGNIAAVVPAGTKQMLVLFRQIGRDEGCTSNNSYRGRLSDVSFQPG